MYCIVSMPLEFVSNNKCRYRVHSLIVFISHYKTNVNVFAELFLQWRQARLSILWHAPVPQLDEEHQREAEHREHLVAHEHGGTRAPAGGGHVLLLAGGTCSCWLGTRGWRVWGYTCLARLTELGRWIMLAESPSASPRKKWRKNSFLFCRIFRSDYPINVWKLVTAADYRDNQGKCSNIRKLIHEHEENLICFMFNLIHSLTIQYN